MADDEIKLLAEEIQERIIEDLERRHEEMLFEAIMAQPQHLRLRLAAELEVDI